MMIEMNKDEATVIIKLAQKIITALEDELKEKHNKQIRESEDSEQLDWQKLQRYSKDLHY